MKVLITAAATAALLGALVAPAPLFAEEDCDNVTKALEEGVAISLKDFETTMADLQKTMSEPADDKKKAAGQEHVLQCQRRVSRLLAGGARDGPGLRRQPAFRARGVRQVDQGDGNRDRQDLQMTRASRLAGAPAVSRS
jgi:hypothetical protein